MLRAMPTSTRSPGTWYFWDPWFVLWGGAFTVAMWRSRPQAFE